MEGKILLLDLGRSDGETNRLIGSLVVTGLEMAMRPGSDELLAGLLMVDRPRPADPEWLAEVEVTFGECHLVAMTPAGERGIACQMQIEPDSLPHPGVPEA
jgi:hypothetical protein